jgi:hypothetical protein
MEVELPDCNAPIAPTTDAPLYTIATMFVALVQVPVVVSLPADTFQPQAHACCVPAVDVMVVYPAGIEGIVVLVEYAKTTMRSPRAVLLRVALAALADTA